MEIPGSPSFPLTVVGYTAYPWEHVLPVLRLAEPLRLAGFRFIHGNSMHEIEPGRVSQADLVVIQRDFPRWENAFQQVVSLARAQGKPIIYEADDLLLDLPEDHPDRPIHYYSRAILPTLQAIIEADAVTASTSALCDYLRLFNPNAYLLPNYLADHIWKLQPPAEKSDRHADDAPIVVGYMGTTSHTADLEMLAEVLQELLEDYEGRVTLRFWGIQPPNGLRDRPDVLWTPLRILDYVEFASYFATQTCDLFLAPLTDNRFNRSKSPLKFLEYSALGVPGIYSQVPAYISCIRHGENGLLASASDWKRCLHQLIDDPDLRFRMGRQAYQTVIQEWRLSAHAQEWRAVYQRVVADAQKTRPDSQQNRQTFVGMLTQIQEWQSELEKQNAESAQALHNLQLKDAEKDILLQQQEEDKKLLLQQTEDEKQRILKQTEEEKAHILQENERLLQQKDRLLQQKDRLLQQKDEEKHLLGRQKEEQIQDLHRRYDELYNSRAVKLTRAMWRVRIALMPPGSRREHFWYFLTNKKLPDL